MRKSFNSNALRSVGADLDLRGIKTFAIRCEDDLLVVDGGYQSPPAPTPVTLHYTRKDIEDLDRKARERNDLLSVTRSFANLSEILPAIETYVRDKGAGLLTVSNLSSTDNVALIEIQYETMENDRVVELLSGTAIHALCVRAYKRESQRRNPDDSRYTRFSSLQDGPLH